MSISAGTPKASQISVTITNNSSFNLYAQKLQIRGYPVEMQDPGQVKPNSQPSIEKYQKRAYNKGLPYTTDQNFVDSLKDYMLNQYALPRVECRHIQTHHKSTLGGTEILGLEIAAE